MLSSPQEILLLSQYLFLPVFLTMLTAQVYLRSRVIPGIRFLLRQASVPLLTCYTIKNDLSALFRDA